MEITKEKIDKAIRKLNRFIHDAGIEMVEVWKQVNSEECDDMDRKYDSATYIVKNAVRCKNCGDIIESKHVHDFVTCSCGSVSVDGGHEYLKRSFMDPNCYEELSVAEE